MIMLRLFMAVLMLFSGIPLTNTAAEAPTVTLNNIVYTLDVQTQTASVTGIATSSCPKEINIPATVDSDGVAYAVKSIGENAFERIQYGGFVKVTLPEGLERIGDNAFDGVYVSDTLVIPDSVVYLGVGAFCANYLDKVVIGSGVEEIPSQAFAFGNASVVELISNVKTIAPDAFEDWLPEKIIVHGKEGSMDAVLKAGGMLEDGAAVEYIVPVDPNAKDDVWLQAQIDAAPEGEPTVISLPNDVYLKKTVTIPAGKNIVLTDEGAEVLVHGSVSPLFSVAAGGALAIQTTGEDELLTFRGGKVSAGQSATVVNCLGTLSLHGGVIQGGAVSAVGSGAIRVNGSQAKLYGRRRN